MLIFSMHNNHFQVLKGHSSAVIHIIVNSDKGEIISAAQDKVIKLSAYDNRILCLHSASFIPVQQSFLKSILKQFLWGAGLAQW